MRPYEFALIRYLHDPSAGEFANIGVVMYDVEERRLLAQLSERSTRVRDFFPDLNSARYKTLVRHVERRLLEADETLRQPDVLESAPENLTGLLSTLLPNDDSCIQASQVMYGVEAQVESRLQELFEEYVIRYEPSGPRRRRDEEDVRRDFDKRLFQTGLVNRVRFDIPIETPAYSYTFHATWQNGKPQVLEPISFDLVEGRSIVEKAASWSGRLYTLAKGGGNFAFNSIVAPPTDPTLERAFSRALTILRGAPNAREIVPELEAERAMRLIASDVDTPAS